jgi:poly(3-hydroxybutyrate) depolymerase
LLSAGQTTSTAWCTTVTGIPIGPEQIPIYAYATNSPGEVSEATATMKPTWTRELTPNGVTVWVHRPEAMYRDPSADVPTLVFFHGRGHTTGKGFDPKGVDRMPRDSGFLELFGQDIPGANPPRVGTLIDLPFLVLAPNCVEGGTLAGTTLECEGWASSDVIYDETIAYAGVHFPIDAHRSYVTGLSTGGEGSFRIAVTRPDKIAAVVPIASTNTGTQWFTMYRCAAVGVPVWAFHSIHDLDGQTSYMTIQFWVDELNGCAPKPPERVQFDLGDWSGPNLEGHAGWLQVYSDTHGKHDGMFTSIYSWLLAHTR